MSARKMGEKTCDFPPRREKTGERQQFVSKNTVFSLAHLKHPFNLLHIEMNPSQPYSEKWIARCEQPETFLLHVYHY